MVPNNLLHIHNIWARERKARFYLLQSVFMDLANIRSEKILEVTVQLLILQVGKQTLTGVCIYPSPTIKL